VVSGFRVGEWLVRPDLNLIERSGEERSLKPKVIEVLVYLAEHAGEVLHKDRLIQAVWPDAFVTDDVLKQAIFQLRKALGDDSKEARYIQTIAKRGYCLIAEVRFPEEDQEASPKRYRLVEKIAQGGVGEVYLAEDTDLGRRVVLKFLRQEKADDEMWNRRFRREARAAAALDHPFICKVYETGTLEGRSFIAMEYVEGETLRDRLKNTAGPLKDALSIARDMAGALAAAHKRGIIHRDLKPSNVMLTESGHVKIMDFGLAKRLVSESSADQDLSSELTRVGATLGTLAYMSPEQLQGKGLDARTDIFSFGVLLYEMVTGKHPFRGETTTETISSILKEDPTLSPDSVGQLLETLQLILRKMLAKDPDRRHQTMQGVQNDLGQLAGLDRRESRPWSSVTLTAAAVLVVGLAVTFWLSFDGVDDHDTPTMQLAGNITADGTNFPTWSPDGRKILFSAGLYDKRVLRILDIDAGEEAGALVEVPQFHGGCWSPDGRWIYYSSSNYIYRIHAGGGKPERVADIWGSRPLVSDDGQHLYYASKVQGTLGS
jgi:serine/threonine protein kinase